MESLLPKNTRDVIPKYDIYGKKAMLSDGSFVDNNGILPLLARGAKKIIIFDMTDSPLINYNKNSCDTQIQPLFGIQQGSKCEIYQLAGTTCQVFNREDYTEKVLNRYVDSFEKGGPVFARDYFEVIPNELNGIKGGYNVDLLFISLQPTKNFTDRLPENIRKEITNESILTDNYLGEFNNFPNYATLFQNTEGAINLKLSQVNLLSTYTDWCLYQHPIKEMIEEMFSS
jgi:hypothetical protein